MKVISKKDLPNYVTTCWNSEKECPLCGSDMTGSTRYNVCPNKECDYAEEK